MSGRRVVALGATTLAVAAAYVLWAGATPYPGVGATVPALDAEVLHEQPPPNRTGVPAAVLESTRDAMGALWISAAMQGDRRSSYHATLYVPRGRVWLRGVSSRIESTAVDETYGVVRWKVNLVVAEDVPITPGSLCLMVDSAESTPALMGNCP